MKSIVLKYIGGGSSIVGWPARDLSETDVERLKKDGVSIETLVQSGLYEYAAKREIEKKEVKDGRD